MKIFVINLKKNIDRWESISRQLDAIGLHYERFDAVHGAELTQAELRVKASRFRWWCVRGVRPTLGEIGCALSHVGVYRKIVDESLPYACILEDDDKLDASVFCERLEAAERFMDSSRPQVVQLRGPWDDEYREKEIIRKTVSQSAEAYVITLAAAKVMIKANFPVRTPVDVWGRFVRYYGLELYISHPSVTLPNTACDFGTDVSDASRRLIVRGVVWKLKRLMGVLIDMLLIKLGVN